MLPLLVCFDVDGTLETSAGPVTVQRLKDLEAGGVAVVIVSPSSLRPKGFKEKIEGTRRDNLLAAKSLYPAHVNLYVSDNGDMGEADAAGFTYVDRLLFR